MPHNFRQCLRAIFFSPIKAHVSPVVQLILLNTYLFIRMRLNAIQFLINSSIMMSTLFIPIFASDLNASGTQIGIIGACYGAALFLSTYIFSRASENYRPKTLLYAGFLCSSVTFFIQMYAFDWVSLALMRAMAGFSAGIYPAVLM